MLSSLLLPVDQMKYGSFENHFFNIVFENDKPFEGFRGPGLALISLGSTMCDPVRKSLRNLNNHFKNIQMYDLGYLIDLNKEKIEEIISMCNAAGIVPVFTGEKLIQQSTENFNDDVFVVSNSMNSHMNGCNFIAYQRHLCRSEDIFKAEEYRYDTVSLGKMRSNPNIMEPILRSVGLLYTDLKAVRSADVPNIAHAYPTGLYAEEFCQILKYAGTGCQIKAVGFSADFKSDLCSVEAELIAESIWYFAEGLNIRVDDHPEKSSDHTGFIIHAPSVDVDLEFFKHNQTGRWWLKHPLENDQKHYLACSYDEYHSSIGDELSDRVFKFINNTL